MIRTHSFVLNLTGNVYLCLMAALIYWFFSGFNVIVFLSYMPLPVWLTLAGFFLVISRVPRRYRRS